MSNESNKVLKKKVRNIDRKSNRNDKLHDLRLNKIDMDLADLQERVSTLEEYNILPPELPPQLPQVVDLLSFRNFIVAHFGAQWCAENVSELKIKCGPVRDVLAQTFDHIQRINDQPQHPDYPHVDENKHRDAIYFRDSGSGEWVIIDFCIASSGSGHLWDPEKKTGNLTWNPVDETPW